MCILKKFLLFTAELSILFFGFIFSAGLTAFLHDTGYRFPLLTFLVAFALVSLSFVLFRKNTGRWTTEADAAAWMKYRRWERSHPQGAKYRRLLRSLLWVPSLCAVFVLLFLPVASHFVYGGHQVAHYRMSTPWNWLLIEDVGYIEGRAFFSEEGASRYGFTPIWFNHRIPSVAAFYSSDPKDDSGWHRPEAERDAGKSTHVAVREFQLGMIRMTCYEYRHVYDVQGPFSGVSEPTGLLESLCATKANGVDHNLRASFFGYPEDLPLFYKVLDSATPEN